MRLCIFSIFLLSVVLIECNHTFLGTNVQRELVYHQTAGFTANTFRKRIEHINFTMVQTSSTPQRCIQGILAYDLTNSGASANVTGGGIGANYVNLRMKSDKGAPMKFDIYIYA